MFHDSVLSFQFLFQFYFQLRFAGEHERIASFTSDVLRCAALQSSCNKDDFLFVSGIHRRKQHSVRLNLNNEQQRLHRLLRKHHNRTTDSESKQHDHNLRL